MRLGLLAALVVALVACSGAPASESCAPGKQAPCACADGSQSEQTCREDGSGFAECRCSDPTSSSSSAGGGGGGGGAGGASSTGGGGSGGAAVCPPATCPSGGDRNINCDPACGAVTYECQTVCSDVYPVTGSPIALQEGTTLVRTPPTTTLPAGCMGACSTNTTWAMHFTMPSFECIHVTGPTGGIILLGGAGTTVCDQQAGACVSVASAADAELVIGLTSAAPSDNGALFTIVATQGSDCQPLDCSGLGCNGDGG